MTKIGETVESLMEKYGSEAFLNHKDEVIKSVVRFG